jgi:pimeloyl-ACP methyl ester carboxylesterase
MPMSRSQVRFCQVGNGQHMAYAIQGRGPLVVLAPWCVSHLERDLAEPKLQAFYDRLAARHTLVRYDHTGVGLSDRDREDFSFEREVVELEALVDQFGNEPIALVGGSFGGPVATAYAARHPDRVSRLVLYGSFAWGAQIATTEVQAAMLALVRAHWGLGAKTLTGILAPNVTNEEARRFTRSQFLATSAEVSAQLLTLFYAMDVRELAGRVMAPTLVIHRQQDRAIPLDAGRDLAARISTATMVTLDGDVHLPWFGAPDVLDAVLEFLGAGAPPLEEPVPTSKVDAELIRAGDVWSIGWGGQRSHLKHAKGLSDIQTLIQNPGTAIAALALAEGGPQLGLDMAEQPVLDERARREFRQRLRDIDVELGEAESHGDLARCQKLNTERQAVLSELESAAGLGMRRRAFPHAAERARKAVSARLRDAIARVRHLQPELGAHLEGSITTGLACVYEPERPIRWRT